MHDPLTVAFSIRRPWPARAPYRDARPDRRRPRWYFRLPFVTVAGRGFYFPELLTVWHREPDGRDSGEVCERWIPATGTREVKYSQAWRFHVHHWRLQLHPLQRLRRLLLTRCEWCHGRSRKGDPVNHAHEWDRERGPWWRGERGLYHRICSSVRAAHMTCVCENAALSNGGHGQCARCGLFRSWGQEHTHEATRLLKAVPVGKRPTPELEAELEAMWDRYREERQSR